MGEEIKDYECKSCGNGFASDEDSILSYGMYCDSCIKVCEMEHELTALREEKSNLESEVKRYREALKQCKSWHLADALRFGSDRERKTWQEQMDVIDSALSEGGSE